MRAKRGRAAASVKLIRNVRPPGGQCIRDQFCNHLTRGSKDSNLTLESQVMPMEGELAATSR